MKIVLLKKYVTKPQVAGTNVLILALPFLPVLPMLIVEYIQQLLPEP